MSSRSPAVVSSCSHAMSGWVATPVCVQGSRASALSLQGPREPQVLPRFWCNKMFLGVLSVSLSFSFDFCKGAFQQIPSLFPQVSGRLPVLALRSPATLGDKHLWSQLHRRQRQKDRLNPGVLCQPGQHREIPFQK